MTPATFLALRYLKANREDRFISWISTLTVVGITIGVTAMIVVLSVISGFETELRNRLLGANPHVAIYRFPAGLKNYQKWEESIDNRFREDITGQSPFVHFDTMGRKDYLMHAILIRGIDPEKRHHLQDASLLVQPPEALALLQEEITAHGMEKPLPAVPSIILGRGILSILDGKVGDTIELISPSNDPKEPFGEMRKFNVVGVYDSGLQYIDNKIGIISVPAAQDLLHIGDVVTGIEIGLKNPDQSIQIANQMMDHFSEISVKEWQSSHRNIFEAMRSEKVIIGLIVALVAFVASFNILTTLLISVTQKRRDIALLKALGATNRLILDLFMKQSILLGLLGTFFGVLLALLLSEVLRNFPFIELPDIYILKTLPVDFDWRIYSGVSLAGITIAAIAGLYPAYVAAKTLTTEGLQDGQRE